MARPGSGNCTLHKDAKSDDKGIHCRPLGRQQPQCTALLPIRASAFMLLCMLVQNLTQFASMAYLGGHTSTALAAGVPKFDQGVMQLRAVSGDEF